MVVTREKVKKERGREKKKSHFEGRKSIKFQSRLRDEYATFLIGILCLCLSRTFPPRGKCIVTN